MAFTLITMKICSWTFRKSYFMEHSRRQFRKHRCRKRYLSTKGRTIRKVMGGGGNFSACTKMFFCSLLMHEYFFSGETIRTNFFFLSEVLIQYLFLCFINYSTLTTDQRIRSFRKCTERRGSSPEWTLPSGIPRIKMG